MDALEIIRQVEADAGLRAQMRAVLLGDELLQLPELVRRLAEAQARTGEQLREFQAAVERRFTALESRADAVGARFDAVDARFDAVDARFDAVDARLDAVDARFDAVDGRLGRLGRDVGDLKGRSLEDRLRADPRRYVPGRVARSVRPLAAERLDELVAGLSPDDADDVNRADAVFAARLADGTDVVFVAEAAFTVHADGIERAVRRAGLLRRAGVDARPIVVAQQPPHQAVADKAQDLGVALVAEPTGLVVAPPA